MKIISLDTVSTKYSIALLYNNIIIYKYICINNLNIFSLLKELLIKNNIKLSNIDLFIFNKGPGSDIGKRLSLTILKCFNLIYKIPFIGVNNLKLYLFYILKNKNIKFYINNIIIIIKSNSYKYKKFYCSIYIIKKKKIQFCLYKKILYSIEDIIFFIKQINKVLIITDIFIKRILLKHKINKVKIYITNYIPNAYSLIMFFLYYKKKILKNNI